MAILAYRVCVFDPAIVPDVDRKGQRLWDGDRITDFVAMKQAGVLPPGLLAIRFATGPPPRAVAKSGSCA
ncbi:MAG: hypothetical protein CSA68_04815 [Rhodobacterales bacterium]|nr:MAG: hypothetical protein CSA68_04815 [Rhodobacterales bacterium]